MRHLRQCFIRHSPLVALLPKSIDWRLSVEDVKLAQVKVVRDMQVNADKTHIFKRTDVDIVLNDKVLVATGESSFSINA